MLQLVRCSAAVQLQRDRLPSSVLENRTDRRLHRFAPQHTTLVSFPAEGESTRNNHNVKAGMRCHWPAEDSFRGLGLLSFLYLVRVHQLRTILHCRGMAMTSMMMAPC